MHQILGSVGYRSVRAGQTDYFPDETGGAGGGLDFQTYVQAGFSFGDTSGVSLSGFAGLGYSWYTFESFDSEELTQPGSGFTLGGGASITYIPGLGVMPAPMPYFSFDNYEFNPSTASYSAESWKFFIWPSPFMFSINYTFSF